MESHTHLGTNVPYPLIPHIFPCQFQMEWISHSRGLLMAERNSDDQVTGNTSMTQTDASAVSEAQEDPQSLTVALVPVLSAWCSYSVDRSTRTTGWWVQSHLSAMSFLSPFSDSSTSWWTRAVVTLQWGLPHTLSCIATTRGSCKSWGGVGEGSRTRAFLLLGRGKAKGGSWGQEERQCGKGWVKGHT